MRLIFTFLCLLFVGAAVAQSKRSFDFNVFKHDSKFKSCTKQMILPATLVTIGVYGYNHGSGANAFNSPAKYIFKETLEGEHIHIDDCLQYAPSIAYLSIGGKEKFGKRFLTCAAASVLTWGMIMPIKTKAGEIRPDLQSDNSFPSGHTATAFMGAELLRLSGHSKKITIPAYITAVTVGCMRIHNNRHWFNDVIAGAGFGILSARFAYMVVPKEKHRINFY